MSERCLYNDGPEHGRYCGICAPWYVNAWWELGYRWNTILWFISRRRGGRPVLGRHDDRQGWFV